MSTPHTCPTCQGTRKVQDEACPTCQGEGVVWERELDESASAGDPRELTGL